MHERVSTQAILRVAKRENVQRDLFADPEHDYKEAVQFYRWPMDWTNRMILGDSLAVMASLARREALAGKVQMIYMDPPYGIKYASNFQPEIVRRDVKDRDEDLTREAEMVKAYRDTWTLGVHSYLSYLRDRFLICRELLSDSGSIFVQIGDENLHRVRALLDEVFGSGNLISTVSFATTTGFTSTFLSNIADHLLWYAKDVSRLKYRQLFKDKVAGEEGAAKYRQLELVHPELSMAFGNETLATSDQATSQGASQRDEAFAMHGQTFSPPAGMHFKQILTAWSDCAMRYD
jgi:adenine-specific DNA-methyltransferase